MTTTAHAHPETHGSVSSAAGAGSHEASTGRDAGPRTVLVVEDDSRLRRVIELLLLRNGFACVVADTIARARAVLAERSVDIVATDLHLPDGNGVEFLRDLPREDDRRQAAVVMSGDHDPRLVAEAHELGYDYLFKPFGEDELVLSVHRSMVRC
jgi:DNA-binding response OmpR family regulator